MPLRVDIAEFANAHGPFASSDDMKAKLKAHAGLDWANGPVSRLETDGRAYLVQALPPAPTTPTAPAPA